MIILFNKPYDVLCQFTDSDSRQTLADYVDVRGVYAAGRLDRDSEGLMILTDNGELQHRITDPKHKMKKVYLVQVEGQIDNDALRALRKGVMLKDGKTLPATARQINEPDDIWDRVPPIRFRQNIPTSWLELGIREGRNRQVRRMTAAVGYPTLRLIRQSIGQWHLGQLKPGAWIQLSGS